MYSKIKDAIIIGLLLFIAYEVLQVKQISYEGLSIIINAIFNGGQQG